MAELDEEALELLRGRNWAVVTTLRADGSPHSTVTWVDTDGEHVLVNTRGERAKARHLRRDPRVAVAVLPAGDPQGRYLTVTGRAVELTEEGAAAHIDKLSEQYLGTVPYPNHDPEHPRLLVKIAPDWVDLQRGSRPRS